LVAGLVGGVSIACCLRGYGDFLGLASYPERAIKASPGIAYCDSYHQSL
jgi:hypothetical protein